MSRDKGFSMRRILFVCYGAGHVNMLVPLILKAQSDPRFDVTVVGLTTASVVLKAKGIPFVGFKDLLEDEDYRALRYGEELASSIPAGGSVPIEETIAYLGLSYNDLVLRHGADKAKEMFSSKGRQAFLPLSVMERIFDRYSPDILVSTNSPRAERAAFMVARDREVPSVCIVGLFAKHEVEWIGEPEFGSRVCVLSESVRQLILSSGRREDEVSVTGNPALDRLARESLLDEAHEFRTKKGWLDKKVILWASQPEPKKHPFTGAPANPSLPRDVDTALLSAASKHPEWKIVIRHHPGESISPRDWPDGAYISGSDEDLAVLLKACDVVVTMTSTVGVEGLLLGKPLVTVNQSVFCADAPYAEMGLARGIDHLDCLEEVLVEVISGRWQPKERLYEAGGAARRIYSVISDLLS